MPANRYFYYDHEACQFVEVQQSRKRLLIRAGLVLSLAVAIAMVGMYVLSQTVRTPLEIAQKEEIQALQHEITSSAERLQTITAQLDELAETDHDLYRTMLRAEPISADIRQVGVGGVADSRFDQYSRSTSDILTENASAFGKLERQIQLQRRSFEDLESLAAQHEARLRQEPAIIPVATGLLTSGFGVRVHPIYKTKKMHQGLDFLVPVGTPIYAAADGIVSFAGVNGGYGNLVKLSHPKSNRETRYAHMSRFADGIEPGTRVRRGQIIGYSGNTGLSTAPHLHYEVRRRTGEALNPVTTFAPGVTPAEYQVLLQRAQAETASLD